MPGIEQINEVVELFEKSGEKAYEEAALKIGEVAAQALLLAHFRNNAPKGGGFLQVNSLSGYAIDAARKVTMQCAEPEITIYHTNGLGAEVRRVIRESELGISDKVRIAHRGAELPLIQVYAGNADLKARIVSLLRERVVADYRVVVV